MLIQRLHHTPTHPRPHPFVLSPNPFSSFPKSLTENTLYPTNHFWSFVLSLPIPFYVVPKSPTENNFDLTKHIRRAVASACSTRVCLSPPVNQTAGVYRMYLVVSPDTASFSRVGYGLQDQLMYASGLITVEADDSSYVCPEIVEEDDETSGARPKVVVTASRASGAIAAGLAAAAAARANL